MENKEEIVMKLKILLKSIRAGSGIADEILHQNQEAIIQERGGKGSQYCSLFRLCNYHGCNESIIEPKQGIAPCLPGMAYRHR